jgi:LPXTG-motif cell wall-anchored protein
VFPVQVLSGHEVIMRFTAVTSEVSTRRVPSKTVPIVVGGINSSRSVVMRAVRAGVLVAVTGLMLMPALVGMGAGAAVAAPRGEGTMLVKDSDDCSGTGSVAKVAMPFSLEFTGFAPFDTGLVEARTQPGDVLVGSGTVQVNEDGYQCVRVDGDVPNGLYKLVYDFGSGTGKQKVVQLVGQPSGPTPTPTLTPTGSPSPTLTPTVTPTPTQTSTSTPTVTASPTLTPTLSPTATATPTASTPVPTSSAGTVTNAPGQGDPGNVDFDQLIPVQLPDTGAGGDALTAGAILLIAGVVAVVASRRRGVREH